jgi:hypothetical protein
MADILQQLQQLVAPILASPKGQAMAQAVLSQMGGANGADPRVRMAANPTNDPPGFDTANPAVNLHGGSMMGRGPATDMEVTDAMAARNQMRPDLPPLDEEAMMSSPREGTTEDELEAARQAMGNQPGVPNTGGTHVDQGGGINKDGPTPQEAQMLRSNPSPRNQANFDKLFGKGAAQMVLGSGGGQNLGTAPGSGGSSYEDDVRGAMDEGSADDDGDHEYR